MEIFRRIRSRHLEETFCDHLCLVLVPLGALPSFDLLDDKAVTRLREVRWVRLQLANLDIEAREGSFDSIRQEMTCAVIDVEDLLAASAVPLKYAWFIQVFRKHFHRPSLSAESGKRPPERRPARPSSGMIC
jgi:hypothetical protein